MCLCGLHLNISYFIDYSTAKYKIDKLNGTGWIASNKFFSLLLHSRLDWSLVHRRVTRRLNKHQTTCHRALDTECHGNIKQHVLIFSYWDGSDRDLKSVNSKKFQCNPSRPSELSFFRLRYIFHPPPIVVKQVHPSLPRNIEEKNNNY